MAGQRTAARRRRAALICLLVALATAAALLLLQNIAIAAYFPRLSRLTTDFSAAYLQRELKVMAVRQPQAIFLGDSVLWGYALPPRQTAIAILSSHGCTCRNLSFKSGNPANDYFLARLFVASGIRPKAVVLELNQAVFNEADDYYRTLAPGVASLSGAFLTPEDRASLTLTADQSENRVPAWLDRTLSGLSLLYAMRSDIRAVLYGDTEPSARPRLRPELFEGTYNLLPLNDKNIGVRYLKATADSLRQARIPLVAFLTPTNHALLHDYIDNPRYRANGAYIAGIVERRGGRVMNLDAAFPQSEFIDDTHLTAAGQRRLADALAAALEPYMKRSVGVLGDRAPVARLHPRARLKPEFR